MTVSALVAQPYFASVTITADATAVSLGAVLRALTSPVFPVGPIASFYMVGNVILYLGTADLPPTGATTWTLAGNTPFVDSGTGIASDQGPNLDNLYLFTTGAGNCTVNIYLRTR